MQKYINDYDVDIKIEQVDMDIVEPQANTATEVALAKARQAYEHLKAPVVVDDSSFHISALGGFPGPYIKYMLSTIGIDGIMKFLDKHKDRSAYFLSSLVFIDRNGKEYVFEDEPYNGTISEKIVDIDHEKSWSDLFKVFIPNGTDKTLVELTDDEKKSLNTQGDSYAAFVRWIKSNIK